MDNIVFYQPSVSSSQPFRLPDELKSSGVSEASIAPLTIRQTASQLSSLNKWKDPMTESRDVSDLPQEKCWLDQHYRNDNVQRQGTYRDTCHNDRV